MTIMDENILKEMDEEIFPITGAKETHKKSLFHIDKEMIRFKFHYFMVIGAAGAVFPFMPIIGKNRVGLSATSLAAIVVSQQFVIIFTKPAIGYVGDYFNKLKFIMNTLLILKIIFLFLVLTVPPIRKDSNSMNIINDGCVDIECKGLMNQTKTLCFEKTEDQNNFFATVELNCNCTVSSTLMKNTTTITQIYDKKQFFVLELLDTVAPKMYTNENLVCSNIIQALLNNSIKASSSVNISDFVTKEFWLLALTWTLASTCTYSLYNLSDTACSESIHMIGGDFGKQRMFGSAAWGTFAAISGFLIDYTNDYYVSWILMAVLQIFAVLNLWKMNLIKPNFSQNLLKDIGKVLKSTEFAAFELGIFFNGLSAGALWYYLLLFLTSLGASKLLCGLDEYVRCFLSELPLMFLSGWFMKKLGHFNIVSLSLLAYAVRFLWYSYLKNPWYVLPAEVLHGFTIGTLFPAMTSYAKLIAEPGTEATTMAIISATHSGIGTSVGCIVAGICFDNIGGHQTFFIFSFFSLAALILNCVNTFLFRKHQTKALKLPYIPYCK